jgi:DNA-binding XRE family transcriptional regulator
MSGRHPFENLRKKMTSEQRANVEKKSAALRKEMTLAELRQARFLTQETLGETLHVGQTSIAKMERRADMYVSNLRRFIEAMGGQLDIVARFPEGAVRIANFSEIGDGPGRSR